MSPEPKGCKKNLSTGEPHSYKTPAEAQALKGQEELLAEIVKEEMAHWTQVSVLSHLHLRQTGEIRVHSPMRSRDSPHC